MFLSVLDGHSYNYLLDVANIFIIDSIFVITIIS